MWLLDALLLRALLLCPCCGCRMPGSACTWRLVPFSHAILRICRAAVFGALLEAQHRTACRRRTFSVRILAPAALVLPLQRWSCPGSAGLALPALASCLPCNVLLFLASCFNVTQVVCAIGAGRAAARRAKVKRVREARQVPAKGKLVVVQVSLSPRCA